MVHSLCITLSLDFQFPLEVLHDGLSYYYGRLVTVVLPPNETRHSFILIHCHFHSRSCLQLQASNFYNHCVATGHIRHRIVIFSTVALRSVFPQKGQRFND